MGELGLKALRHRNESIGQWRNIHCMSLLDCEQSGLKFFQTVVHFEVRIG
jgi:hypothetical protein